MARGKIIATYQVHVTLREPDDADRDPGDEGRTEEPPTNARLEDKVDDAIRELVEWLEPSVVSERTDK